MLGWGDMLWLSYQVTFQVLSSHRWLVATVLGNRSRRPSAVFNGNGDCNHPCLITDLNRNTFTIPAILSLKEGLYIYMKDIHMESYSM